MSGSTINSYIVSVKIHDENLTDCNELTNHFTLGGFLLTMKDEQGQVRDLGSHTFGLLSPLSIDEVKNIAQGLCASALNKQTEISVVTWDEWQKSTEA